MSDLPEIPDYARRRFGELLDDVASETPAPGGGASAAWATALAAALVEMAARFAGASEVGGRAAELRAQALQLAERDLGAYLPVLEALRLPRDDPGRGGRLDGALSEAAEPPLEIARVAAEVAEEAAGIASRGNRSLEGDAMAGLLLAEGACRAASRLVAINLRGRPDDARLDELRTLLDRASAARSNAPSA